MADPLKYYETVEGYNLDLKYLSSLYLYAKTFQKVNKTDDYQKEDEELVLYTYEDENKIAEICKNINLSQFIDYIKQEEEILDCWEDQNEFYFSDYKEEKSFNIYSLPYCTCLPLYCLNNFKSLKKDGYKFSENDYAKKINLPNKCQNKFMNYESSSSDNQYTGNNKFLKFINASFAPINYDYIKILYLNLAYDSDKEPNIFCLFFT